MNHTHFDVQVPVDDDGLRRNVDHALSLRLPELRDFEYPHRGYMNIVASGPSARDYSFDGGPAIALNGALGLFNRVKQAPTYWAACDPQPLVADFVEFAPANTVYLVASKCDPSVFDYLLGQKREIIVWHVADNATWGRLESYFPVQAWVSVTITVFELLARLGWRKFDVWGWDGCFLGDDAYALQGQAPPGGGEFTNALVGDVPFVTTNTWILEAQSAVQALAGFPFPIHVHGAGMIPELLKTYLPKRVMTDNR